MTDMLSIFAGTIWAWLNAEQNAGALSAVLAVLTLTGGAGGWLWQRKSKAPAPDRTGGIHVSASTGETMTGNTITINIGLTPEQIAAIFAGVRDLSQSSEAKAIAAADQFGTISREALTSFFTIVRHEQVPPEHLTAKLTTIALQYREMMDRLIALEQATESDDHPVLANARAAVVNGQYNCAEELLASFEEEQGAAPAKPQADSHEVARRQAAIRAARAVLSAMRLDYRTAADHLLAAANLLPVGDIEQRTSYLADSADCLQQYGEERGNNSALYAAIARYREALPPRNNYPALWTRIQNSLGSSLSILGKRQGNSTKLQEAVDAYSNALSEITRDHAPLDWAGTLNNLAGTLLELGKYEKNNARILEAINIYDKALHGISRDHDPLLWAKIQNNLGNSLQILGKQEGDNSLLRRSADAYANALLEITRKRAPHDWAITQSNLGSVLTTLGKRDENIGQLQEAVGAFENALLEQSRDKAPLKWASTQNNLGNALQSLGTYEGNISQLRQALAAYRNALLEVTRDRAPLAWAEIKNNIGQCLQTLAALTHDMDAAEQAIVSHEAALEVFTELNLYDRVANTNKNLAVIRVVLATITVVTNLKNHLNPAPHQ